MTGDLKRRPVNLTQLSVDVIVNLFQCFIAIHRYNLPTSQPPPTADKRRGENGYQPRSNRLWLTSISTIVNVSIGREVPEI